MPESEPGPTVCITCGQAASQPPRLNRFEDGRVCPSCRDRLLDSLAPPMSGWRPTPEPAAEQASKPIPAPRLVAKHPRRPRTKRKPPQSPESPA